MKNRKEMRVDTTADRKKKKGHGLRRFLTTAAVVVTGFAMLTFWVDSDDGTQAEAATVIDNDAVKAEIGHYDNCYILNQMDTEMLDNFMAFYDAAANFKDEVVFPHPISDENEYTTLLLAYYYECPENFQLDADGIDPFQYNSAPGAIAGCDLTYAMDRDTYQSNLNQCRGIADTLKKQTEGMSDYDKELYVYDYLTDTIEYDDTTAYCGSAYGALIEGRAKCSGISMAFKYICDEMDMPCVVLFSLEDDVDTGHAWNVVQIDGEWHDVDVTADIGTGAGSNDGYRYYGAFNVPRTWITDAGNPVSSYYTKYFSTPESTSYDEDYHVLNGEFAAAGSDYAAQYRDGITSAFESGDTVVYLQFESEDDYTSFMEQESDIREDWFYNYSSDDVQGLGGAVYRQDTYRTVIYVAEFS